MNIREGAREEAAWKVYLHETTTLCLGGSPPGNQLSPVQGGGAGGSSAFVKTRLFRPSLYNTKSDLTVEFVMLRRYEIFCLIGYIPRVKKYIFSPGDLRPVHQSPVAAVRVGRPVVAAEHDVNVQALRHGEFPGGYLDLGVALVAGEGYPRQQVRRIRPGGVEVPHDQLVIGPGETVLAGGNGPVDEQRPLPENDSGHGEPPGYHGDVDPRQREKSPARRPVRGHPRRGSRNDSFCRTDARVRGITRRAETTSEEESARSRRHPESETVVACER